MSPFFDDPLEGGVFQLLPILANARVRKILPISFLQWLQQIHVIITQKKGFKNISKLVWYSRKHGYIERHKPPNLPISYLPQSVRTGRIVSLFHRSPQEIPFSEKYLRRFLLYQSMRVYALYTHQSIHENISFLILFYSLSRWTFFIEIHVLIVKP